MDKIHCSYEYKTLMEICSKLKQVKDCELTEEKLFNLMYSGLYSKKTFPFVSYDNKKMNGCLVLNVGDNLISGLSLYIIFVWIDRKYPELWKSYMQFIDDAAKEFKVKRIIGSTKRNASAIERKYGKYGFKKTYSIIEKSMIEKEAN